ncbi:MAG: hypothetical protein JSW39_14985 [Desulfobacterales bacterium]|nr:MAG: hypothetical protein JSW39_14985 [Desulfobacterales bacterium]
MDRRQLDRFKTIIHAESINLGRILDSDLAAGRDPVVTPWPLEQMRAQDLVIGLKNGAQNKLGIRIHAGNGDEDRWVRVDRYSFMLALLFVVHHLQKTTGKQEFNCRTAQTGRFVGLDLLWKGDSVKIETLRGWDQ